MAGHGSSKGRCRLWPVVLAAFGVALVSLLALVPWDLPPARAEDQKGGAHQITLEHSTDPAFQHKLIEATNRGDVETQIVGGTAVPDGKYPFMAVLALGFSDDSTGLCGGSLIDSDSVLTAAHCLVDAQSVDLAVGRTVISQNQGKLRFATQGFIHPSYNDALNSRYDAAVLKLNRAVGGIKPIKLATASQNFLEKPGRKLRVAGWGTTSEGGNTTDRMREVSVPVVSDATAQSAYASTGDPDLQYFPELMVAAGETGKDSCQGDSGGPLFKPGTTNTQVGIVSYGLGCAKAGFPGVYTEVNNSGIRTFIVNAAQ
jgi:secreted trypsin-like serine protease